MVGGDADLLGGGSQHQADLGAVGGLAQDETDRRILVRQLELFVQRSALELRFANTLGREGRESQLGGQQALEAAVDDDSAVMGPSQRRDQVSESPVWNLSAHCADFFPISYRVPVGFQFAARNVERPHAKQVVPS